ncbi:MAG: acetolactate synthase large subunit, partial [Actinomycetota bacterium]|nr:acetolactate synthase large subunit [Actinomycetota bacterium]
PGVANVVNGLAHALLDQSPVVLISDRFTDAELATTGHQVLDHAALLAPVTKWQETLSAANAAAAIERAFTEAATEPRGPVHLELPRDVAAARPAPAAATEPLAAREPDTTALVAGATAVARARRPLILVGDEAAGVRQAELVALAELLDAPVLTSYKGKGCFPEDHPLWCGIVTNAAIEADLLAAADVILAVGLDPIELLPRPWTAAAPILALRAHGEAVPGYRPAWTAAGDVAALVGELSFLVRETASEWTPVEVGTRRRELLAALRIPAPGSLSAVEIVEAVLAEAPPSATVTVDAGAHMFAATWFWRATRPRRFLISNGLATMGFAVPAAVAAALARPGEPVVVFTGDGGFLLHGSELETATRLGVKIVVVVLNDASLSLIRIKQEDKQYRRLAVDFSSTTLDAIGPALGAAGSSASGTDELRAAVREAFAAPGSTVVEARLAGSEYQELQRVIRGGRSTSELAPVRA